MIGRLLAKARQALTTARRDLDDGDTDAAANRSYYAVFYAAWAMFVAHGLAGPKTHSGLIAEFSKRFVRDGQFDRSLGATLGKLESALNSAAAFVAAVEKAISGLNAASN